MALKQWIDAIREYFKRPPTYDQQWKNNYFTKEVI